MQPRARLIIMASFLLAAMFAGAGAASSAETVTMITVGKGQPPQWPLFIANAKGFFAENGVVMDFVAAQSASAATQQLAAGSAQMSVGGMTEVLMGIDHGAKVSLLRIETQVPPYSLWAKPTIKSIKELRNKIVIVGGATDVTRVYFERMAAPNGLKPGDYDLLYAGTTPARLAALTSGAVDGAILYPPGSFKAASEGYSKLAELSEYVTDLPFTGYAVETAWAVKHRPTLIGFLKGIRKGVAWFYDTSHRAEVIDILVKESGSSRDDVEKTFDYYTALRVFPNVGTIDVKSIGPLVQAVAGLGVFQGSPDPQRFVDPEMARLAAEAQ